MAKIKQKNKKHKNFQEFLDKNPQVKESPFFKAFNKTKEKIEKAQS